MRLTSECPKCNGSGKVVESSPYILGTPMSHSISVVTCDLCRGKKEISMVLTGDTKARAK